MSDLTPGDSVERSDLSDDASNSVWPPPPSSGSPTPIPAYPVVTNGAIILVLGIVSILLCGLLGIAPWIMGNKALRAIDQGLANPQERSMVNGGRICGIVGVGLSCAGVLLNLGLQAFEAFSRAKHF